MTAKVKLRETIDVRSRDMVSEDGAWFQKIEPSIKTEC
jgi:hypothetical protein